MKDFRVARKPSRESLVQNSYIGQPQNWLIIVARRQKYGGGGESARHRSTKI